MLVLLVTAAFLALAVLGGAIAWEARHPARRTLAWALVHKLPVDPAEMGLAFEEWMLDCPDGVRLPVWDVSLDAAADSEATDRAPATSPPGRTLVLLHGWGRSRIDSLGRLAAILEAVPGRFQRALLPELRGHGEAMGSTCRLGDGEERDLLALLERIAGSDVVLAGHSLGATIAIRAAALPGPATAGPSHSHRSRTRKRAESGARVSRRAGVRRPGLESAMALPATACITHVIAWAPYDEVATPIVNRLRAAGAVTRPFTDAALVLLRTTGIRRVRTLDAARRLRVPLLVIAGRDDVVSPVAGCEAIAAAAPRGRCAVLPGGHPDMHRADPAGHAGAIREFLATTADRTTGV